MTAHRTLGRAFGLLMSAAPIVLLAAGNARAAPPRSEAVTTVEVVTVTANKRAQSLQKVAASISAVSGATIQQQRLQTYTDLQNAVAGLVSVPGPADFGGINMRGTYTGIDDSPGVDEPSSVYIDDLATFGHVDRDQKLFDIDRVEVLRGPQGTAFGKNTIGGVISIHTRPPSFTPEADLSATGGSYGLGEFQGLVTGPLNDRVAVKLSGYYHRQDGYVDDPTLGEKIGAQRAFGVRGQVLANVTDKFKVLASADYLQDDSDSPPMTYLGDGAFVASTSPFYPALNYPTFGVPNAPDKTLQNVNFRSPHKDFNAFVRADWDLDFATLTSITGYRLNKSTSEKSELGDPVNFFDSLFEANDWEGTEELRLVSPDDRKFTWLVGAYLSTSRMQRTTILPDSPPALGLPFLGSGPQYDTATSKDESAAGFAEISYRFIDQLRLVLGGRYTYDHKRGSVVEEGGLQGGVDGTVIVAPQEGSWSAFTPKATLEFTPTKDTLFYATVSRGYVGGGFEGTGPGAVAATVAETIAADITSLQVPFKPEYATNYEIGAKTSWFDNRVTANIDIYREDFKNLQVVINSLIPSPAGPIATTIAANSGRTRSQGLDLEIHAAPTPWLRLGAIYSYADDKYLTTDAAGFAGNYLPFTPKNALNLSAQGQWRQDWGTISIGGDVTFRSKVWSSNDNGNSSLGPFYDPPPVHDRTGINGLLNASVDFQTADGRWDVRLWGKNLTDTRFGTPQNGYGLLASGAFGYTGSYYALMQWNPPRTFGVTLTVHVR
ncbi:MAG TPA: TonB-dependent receptor [Caulobacteraceae bacterium]|jgi:iron complex outermembrane receptor protein|nr:TonB-dependent receptor [Caulobacteraceae bacterium]